MKTSLLLLCLAACAIACGGGDDTCKNYASLEWKCGDYPEAEKDITLRFAEAMCAGVTSSKESDEFSDMLRVEIECAKKSKDCTAYAACQKAAAEK